jgi:hypothetical protein
MTLQELINKVYIVKAPLVLKYDNTKEYYLPMETINGKNRLVNLDRFEVFGLPIIKIAKGYEDGYTIYLYNKKDIYPLLKDLETYLEIVNNYNLQLNMEGVDKSDYDLLKNFATDMVKLNKSKFIREPQIKKLQSQFGFINLYNKTLHKG